jgi:hypothetical protein
MAEGELAAGTDVTALGTYYAAVAQGLSIQARDGVPPDELAAIAALAMAAWPKR